MKDEIKLKDMTDFLENVYKNIKEQPTLEEEQKQEKEFINKIKGDNKDEIKEILYCDIYNDLDEDKYEKILDYITNLQKENDILKRDIKAMKHNYNLLVRCIENGESMTQKFENGLTYQDYKTRNEKAIELINKYSNYPTYYLTGNIVKDLLTILQGKSDE